MTQRLAISKAPKAELGREGAIQSLPVASADPTGKVTAESTTIADMRDYFGSGDIVQTAIRYPITFNPDRGPGGDVINGPLAVNGYTPQFSMHTFEDEKEVLTGDGNLVQSYGDRIEIPNGSTFFCQIIINADLEQQVNLGAARLQLEVNSRVGLDSTLNLGQYIRPQSAGARSFRTCNEHNYTFKHTAGQESLIIQGRWQNIGSIAIPEGVIFIIRDPVATSQQRGTVNFLFIDVPENVTKNQIANRQLIDPPDTPPHAA